MIPSSELAARWAELSLETPRLVLRRFSEDDLAVAVEHELDPRIMQYVRDPLPLEETEARVRDFAAPYRGGEREWTGLVIARREAPELMLGVVAFRIESIANETAEIGYRLHPDHWRQGLTFEACRRMVEFLADEVRVHKIVAYCVAENVASARLMEKLGMQREACLRQFSRLGGAWRDELVYGLLPAEDAREA